MKNNNYDRFEEELTVKEFFISFLIVLVLMVLLFVLFNEISKISY